LFDEKDEIRIGRDIADRVESERALTFDPDLVSRVNRVGQMLIPYSARPWLPYSFNVINDRDINALAAPGGYIYVNSGVLHVVDSDDELAAVLAHEIAHAANGHGIDQLERNIGLRLGVSVVLRLMFGRDSGRRTWELVSELGLGLVMQGYSRENEHDADLTGVQIMREAGYDPYAMVRLLKRLQDMESNEPSRLQILFSTHPPIRERISKVEEYIKTKDKY